MPSATTPPRQFRNHHHPDRPAELDHHDHGISSPGSATAVTASKLAKLLTSPAMTRLPVPTSLNGTSVRRFLTQHHAIPSAKLHALINKRRIYLVVSGSQCATRVADLGLRLTDGDLVVLDAKVDFFEPEPVDDGEVDEDMVKRVKSWIVHVDDRMVVINKPGGVAVQGGSRIGVRESIDGMMPAIARAVGAKGTTLRLVHRIDKVRRAPWMHGAH
ncbi:hypothetical protein GGF31_006906 [Allomyces arbusculus]|nr:hypothetical protein GGF31_006906 [Allomyces arbusculus]